MTSLKNANVLISGAGVAGLTLAYWLNRHGAKVTVVERAAALRDGGYKVDVRGAALDVIRRMDLLDAVRGRKTDVRAAHVVDARGKKVAGMDADTFGGRVHDDAELLRGDLTRLLYDATRVAGGGVEYRFGDAIAGLDDATVTFESGDTLTYDLMIGADGVNSRTRALAFGPDGLDDLGHYVAIYSVPNHLRLDREELTYVNPGRTTLCYSTAGQSDMKAMFLFSSPKLAYDPRDRAAQQRLLREAYGQEGWEVPKLLDGMDAAPDFYFDSIAQVRLGRWSRGRVALVGDAAYCASLASGQGTSLALVGAYVLAGELARASTVDDAFAAYETLMRPYVERNQALGPANIKRMVLAGKGQVRMSMVMAQVLDKLPGKDRLLAKIMEPIHKAATAITLPMY
jgi:2-polyprenyl-6-methoxyphenol hydroxylase-like FAD-dependent oxidoreductase